MPAPSRPIQQSADPIDQDRIQPRPQNSTSLSLFFAVQAPDGTWITDEYFWAFSFSGKEQLSSPFEFEVELRANTCTTPPLSTRRALAWPQPNQSPPSNWAFRLENLLGLPATVAIAQPNLERSSLADVDFRRALTTGGTNGFSWFNGIITRIEFSEPGCYRVVLQPALFRLTLSNHYRVLTGNVVGVIQTVLEQNGIAAQPQGASCSLVGPSYRMQVDWLACNRVQSWLQAGESDLEFVQRLMSKANLYYYFDHQPQGHAVVFSNLAAACPVEPPNVLRYAFTDASELGASETDVISEYRYQRNLTATSIRVCSVRQELSSECDRVAQAVVFDYSNDLPKTASCANSNSFALYQPYSYGGSELETSDIAQQRLQMLAAATSKLSGASRAASLRVGGSFTLSEGQRTASVHPEQIRPGLNGACFVLTSVNHQASNDGRYQNSFEAIELGGIPTEFGLQQTHQESILATVVANHGPEPASIPWDFLPKSDFDFARASFEFLETSTSGPGSAPGTNAVGVHVHFVTDPEGAKPVWVRLSASMTTIPQVGALVLVSRSQDHSEVPEIQNVVDSHGILTAKPLAANGQGWQCNTNVGSNRSTSYGDSQNVRFGANSPTAQNLDAAVSFVKAAYANVDAIFRDGGKSAIAKEGLPIDEDTSKAMRLGEPVLEQCSKELLDTISTSVGCFTDPVASCEGAAESAVGVGPSASTVSALIRAVGSQIQLVDNCLGAASGGISSLMAIIPSAVSTTESFVNFATAAATSAVSTAKEVATAGSKVVAAAATALDPTVPPSGAVAAAAQSAEQLVAAGADSTAKALEMIPEFLRSLTGSATSQYALSQGAPSEVSYSQGSSCTYSESDNGPDGVLSRSISRGSTWSSSVGAWTRSYSVTGSSSDRASAVLNINPFTGMAVGSQNWVFGDSASEEVKNGNSTSESTVRGSVRSASTVTGSNTSVSNYLGKNVNVTTTLGENVNANTVVGANVNFNATLGVNANINVTLGPQFDINITNAPKESNHTFTEMVVENSVHLLDHTVTETVAGARTETRNVAGVATVTHAYQGEFTHSQEVAGAAGRSETYLGDLTHSQNVTGAAMHSDTFEGDATISKTVTGAAEETRTYTGELTTTKTALGEANETASFLGESTRTRTATSEVSTVSITSGVSAETDTRPTVKTCGTVTQTAETTIFL